MRKTAKYFQFTSRYHDIINNYTLFITILSTIQEVIYPFHCLDLNINSPLCSQQIRYNCSFENLVLNLSISSCSYSTNFFSSCKLFLCVFFMPRKQQRWPQIKQQINPFNALWLPLYCQISTNRHLFQFPFCQVTKCCDMDKADMSLGIYIMIIFDRGRKGSQKRQ